MFFACFFFFIFIFSISRFGQVHGKLGQHEEAIDCYRRSIAVRPAAPAYVAWALVVARMADRKEKETSSKRVCVRAFCGFPCFFVCMSTVLCYANCVAD